MFLSNFPHLLNHLVIRKSLKIQKIIIIIFNETKFQNYSKILTEINIKKKVKRKLANFEIWVLITIIGLTGFLRILPLSLSNLIDVPFSFKSYEFAIFENFKNVYFDDFVLLKYIFHNKYYVLRKIRTD